MSKSSAAVGVSIPKQDAPDKVTGRAVYVEDVNVPGLLHGATVRSTIPRGRIKSIELDAAFDWRGVVIAVCEANGVFFKYMMPFADQAAKKEKWPDDSD